MKKITGLLLLLLSNQLLAEVAATVLFTSNKVIAEHNSSQRTLSRGSTLEAGDSIITSAGALANIKYTNGTLVNVGADSNYTILAYSPKQGDVQIKAELSYGKISSKTTGKTKEAVKTPVIALAILGTEYNLAVVCKKKIDDRHREDCSQLNLQVIQGSIMAGGTLVTSGQSIQATPSGIKPAPFPPKLQVVAPARAAGAVNSSSSSDSFSEASSAASQTQVTTYLTTTTTTSNTAQSQAYESTAGGIIIPPNALLPILPGRN